MAVAGGCELSVPRPIAPASTSIATSRTPSFRWLLPTGVDGARVEVCRDRACTMIVAMVDATGSSTTLTGTVLPPGVVYWRLRGLSGTTVGDATSPVWQFTVPAQSASGVNTSWGSTIDVDGNGFADTLVAAYASNDLYVFAGSRTGIAATAASVIRGPGAPGAFGLDVGSAGDTNGDGYGDVVVGGLGRAYVYAGGPGGLGGAAVTALMAPSGMGFGSVVAGVGDIDGDGYADVAVGAPDLNEVFVYPGTSSGTSMSPIATLTAPTGAASFGTALAAAGDVDGDGFADLIVGAGSASAVAFVYRGGASGLLLPPIRFTGGAGSAFGRSVTCAGDVNNDGYSDVAVGESNTGTLRVYNGGPTGPSSVASTLLAPPTGATGFGTALVGAGDLDGDGFDDLVVGSSAQMVYVYLGTAAGLGTTLRGTIHSPGTAAGFGLAVGAPGDVEGDGFMDIVVGTNGANAAYVFSGPTIHLLGAPTASLGGASGESTFGSVVASRSSWMRPRTAGGCPSRRRGRVRAA